MGCPHQDSLGAGLALRRRTAHLMATGDSSRSNFPSIPLHGSTFQYSNEGLLGLQVYVRGKPSLDARCAAEEAFLASCTGVSAATPPPGDPSQPLVVPAAWPHTISVSSWVQAANLTTVGLDAALLEAHLAALAAHELAERPDDLVLEAAAQSSTLAAMLPSGLLGAMLQGTQAEGQPGVARNDAVDARAWLVWHAGACFAERARPGDRSTRRLWLEHLVGPMQVSGKVSTSRARLQYMPCQHRARSVRDQVQQACYACFVVAS